MIVDWATIGIAVLTGIFGGGVVWGALRQQIKDHDKRLDQVEEDIHELQRDVVPALARLEGKMDIIVHQVIQEEN